MGNKTQELGMDNKTQELVVVSDLHLHPWAAFATGVGINNSRFQQTLKILRQSLDYARKRRAIWIMAGDWVHTIGSVQHGILNSLIDVLFEYADVQKLTVWGNHDARSRGGVITQEETLVHTFASGLWENSHWGVCVMNEYWLTLFVGRDLTFYGAGYQPKAQALIGAPGARGQGEPYAPVGIYHQQVKGATTPGGWTFEHGLPLEELWRAHALTIVGDIHHPQRFVCPETGHVVFIPGSPEHHNFGDKGAHGWWVVKLESDEVTNWHPIQFTLHESNSPKFLTVPTVDMVQDDGNFYRILENVDADQLPDNAVGVRVVPSALENRTRFVSHNPTAVVESWLEQTDLAGIDHFEYSRVGRELLSEFAPVQISNHSLTKVTVRDFMCYEEIVYEPQTGVVLVTGASRDYVSNGAGKTTLFDAIYWALFGKTTKGLAADDVIRWGTERAQVELQIQTSGGADYMYIRRTRKKGSSDLEVVIQDEVDEHHVEGPTVKDVQQQTLGILGLTPDVYKALGYFSQERVFLFSKATDAERKEMLADLLGLKGYSDAASHAAQEAKRLATEIDAESRVRITLDEERNSAYGKWMAASEEGDGWSLAQAKKIKDATQLIDPAVANLDTKLERYDVELEPLVEQGLATQASINVTELYDRRTEATQNIALCTSHSDNCTSQLEAQAKRNEEVKIQLAKVRTSICPTCGQSWEYEEVEEYRKKLENELEQLAQQAHDLGVQLATSEDNKELWQNALAHVTQELQKANEANAQMDIYRKLKAERDHVQTLGLAGIEELRKELRHLQEETNPHEAVALQWAEKCSDLDDQLLAKDMLIEKNRAEMHVMEFWAHGFGRQGVQSILLTEVVDAFNAARGIVLPLLTGGLYDVVFSSVSATQKGEAREKSEFQVYYRGQRVPYEGLSGGQKRRLDVGIMLTLLLAVCKTRGINGILGMLILDEVFSGLDAAGGETLAAALNQLTATIPSVYLMTHDPRLQHLFPQTLHVVQNEEGISCLT